MGIAMRLLLILLLLLLLGGCKTMQAVPHDDLSKLQGQVERGDRVEVVTTDGRTLDFTVTEVTADALAGDNVRVEQPEIASLRVKAVSKPRTFGAAFGGAGTLVLILLGIAMGGLMGGS
jgi:hypothetical protein